MPTLRLNLGPEELDSLKATLAGRGIAEAVGDAAQAEILSRFERQAWAPHPVPNAAGVVKDVNKGRAPQIHRFQARPTLVDSGRLMDTIDPKVQNNHRVTVTAQAPYSGLQNDGGQVKIRLTNTGKRTLSAWLKKTGDMSDLGWILHKKEFTVNVRARKFMRFEGQSLTDLAHAVLDYVKETI